MFADQAKVYLKSGKGGDGHISFRRELYVPAGGPDGGDGGDGGDVIIQVDTGQNTLNDFRNRSKYAAGNGEEGGKRRCHGKKGSDVVLRVPPGTVIKDYETGKVIHDMAHETEPYHILKGGKGGNGNMHYATPTMQAPRYAQSGGPAQELTVMLELKVIAEVGLVGFPNVGKSTLLSRVSKAEPKIANYHFTTLNPNLGVVDLGQGRGFVMADIPGIIEGASEGTGLGLQFLRHVERTKVLVHVVDAASVEGRDPVEDIRTINSEIEKYNPDILKKPAVIAANKLDAAEDPDAAVSRLREAFEDDGTKVYPISAATGQGVRELLWAVYDLLQTCPKEDIVFQPEMYIDTKEIPDAPIEVVKTGPHEFSVNGDPIERMLGYTNLDSEKGFAFFERFLKERGINDRLEKLGIEEGDTVNVSDLMFDYYKS